MSAKNGGTVFPYTGTAGAYSGMSLRDYFAAKAMATLSTLEYAGALYELAGEIGEASDAVAKAAYEIADAMLRAREVAK